MNSNISRRSWLKQSALAAGGVMGGIVVAPALLAKPAFGMSPLNKRMLTEEYKMPEDKMVIKARLSANENPWGPSKKAVSAIAESASRGNRYAGMGAKKMVDMVAELEGVSPDNILLSAGSTDLLEKTAFALCMRGGNVISADPSYMSLVKTAQAIGATWKNIPLRPDYGHDLDVMEKSIDADTKLIYVCNPNNPTGTLTPIDELKAFCKKVAPKAPVFVDEAYLELLDNHRSQTTVGLVKEGYDVIVCRTFSKIHGMAGLRMGYMVASPERIKSIRDLVRTEMGISVTSLEGAMASMMDADFQTYSRQQIKEGREFLLTELKKSGLKPLPSYTNFVLFPIQMPTKELMTKMMEKGVAMRGFDIMGKPYGRVSVGTPEELKLFVKSINDVVS